MFIIVGVTRAYLQLVLIVIHGFVTMVYMKYEIIMVFLIISHIRSLLYVNGVGF